PRRADPGDQRPFGRPDRGGDRCGRDFPGGGRRGKGAVNPLDRAPHRVRVVEVGPRDGLQNESAVVSVDVRGKFIMGLAAAAGREVMALAAAAGCRVRGYVSTSWWCPYSGRVVPERVRSVARALVEMGCYEVAISDTIGAATPAEVISLLESLSRDLPASAIAVHFHDTRGTALANVLAALACGISTVDASAGGLGGCPYAPGASGNLATED